MGPDASWTREGDARRSCNRNSLCGRQKDSSLSETRQAAPSLCGGSVDSRAIVLKTKLSFLKPGQDTVHIFCEHLSPGDESTSHPRPKYLRQVEGYPF